MYGMTRLKSWSGSALLQHKLNLPHIGGHLCLAPGRGGKVFADETASEFHG